ncbi:hypothetical protein [Massilia glaciei]|uniref:Uncharacterized protein n=1 Tax=Massilia glaciei TaxID=1524097 RepID=A0A2U2HNQ8_9BURK|nr:hypothetical protein [Massilia glaciei]PWF49045.1 hypothetical protein C7C56_009190 [Massilia glaciei]
MRYGDWERKLALLQPVFDRVRYVHGRIADAGAMQVPVTDLDAQNVHDFRRLWTCAMAGFLSNSDAGDRLYFAPELLPNHFDVDGATVYSAYARQTAGTDGVVDDDSDRWLQGLLLTRIGAECFDAAGAGLVPGAAQSR